MVQPSSSAKNLWVAASDGDIDRVRQLIEREGAGPNDKDSNSYTPMHAAASYHHFELLEYLLSVGGDINVTDEEGETPLFTVESVEAAKWLVEHGADVEHVNEEGQNAADYHDDDHPEITLYLRSLSSSSNQQALADADSTGQADAESSAIDAFASNQADALMEQAQRLMAEAAARGEDPEAALQDLVQKAVRDGLQFGGGLQDGAGGEQGQEEGQERKRNRTDGV